MKYTFTLLLPLLMSFSLFSQQSSEISLNDGWRFTESGKNEWYDAQVPGSVQRDLIRHEVLPDPYWGTNEKLVQWVEDKNWDFEKKFYLTAEQLKHDEAVLLFEGLDTYADVFLNGSKLFHAENMFVAYETSVKNLLKAGENHLMIRFYSPIEINMPAHLTTGFDYPADNDHRLPRMSVYSRKAPYHFGWDWGMRMVQIGIWRPVTLKFFDRARIEDFWVQQLSVRAEKARINNRVELFSFAEGEKEATLKVEYSHQSSKFTEGETELKIRLKPGLNQFELPLEIENPKLWMPVEWGEAHLYNFKLQVEQNGDVIAEKMVRTGLRDIQFVYDQDPQSADYGSFYFMVNGIPLFAKGANYIPGEIINSQQDKAYYERLFENIEAANMNMVRIWGGGFYEDDYFYELADEKGILVWQDFMFGCTTYPHDDAFLKNVEKEADYNLRRLRNFASVALWCGNNEVAEGIKYWGWDKKYSPEVMQDFRDGYDLLFKDMLAERVQMLDPQKSYIHTSPDTANWGRKETWHIGDAHYWGVWYGRQPFEILDERVPRFMSEFGFQAFPEMKTIRSFAAPDQWSLESETMLVHQKSSTGNDAIQEYMERYYHTPKNFEDFIYLGLVMQGRGMAHGIKAHRRNRPYCMGTLYWQLNDSWPVVSWAGIDYYGNWKALHYHARDAFKPLTVSAFEEKGKIDFYTFSDLLEDNNGLKLDIRLIDFKGKTLMKQRIPVSAKANSSEKVFTLASNIVSSEQRKNSVMHIRLLDNKNREIASENFWFDVPKNLNLPTTDVKYSIKTEPGNWTISMKAARLAKDVFIEVPPMGAKFSDNFFDLLPGEKKTIVITSPELGKVAKPEISVRHIRETY